MRSPQECRNCYSCHTFRGGPHRQLDLRSPQERRKCHRCHFWGGVARRRQPDLRSPIKTAEGATPATRWGGDRIGQLTCAAPKESQKCHSCQTLGGGFHGHPAHMGNLMCAALQERRKCHCCHTLGGGPHRQPDLRRPQECRKSNACHTDGGWPA